MNFTFFNYIHLIIKTTHYYIFSFQILTLIKFFIVLVFILLNFIINHICLLLDNILFSFHSVKIKKPLFIIGFPRSGTTFLHKMILNDSQFTTPYLWELIFAPSIIQKKIYNLFSNIFKKINFVSKTNQLFRPLTYTLDNIHEIHLNNPEEDYLFLIPFGGCFLLTLIFPIEEIWNLYNFDKNFTDSQRLRLLKKYKTLVKRHLYFYGKDKIYLSKNPHFTCFSKSLINVFPDCNIVGCHRDPIKSLPSVLTSMEPGYKLMSRKITDDIHYFIDMYVVYFSALKIQHLENHNFVLIEMKDIKNNLKTSIFNIYKTFNYNLNNEFINLIKQESNKSKNFVSKNKYSLKYFHLDKIKFKETYKEYYSYIEKN